MKATDVLKHSLTSTQFILTTYLSDLSDADLLVRPAPGANHLAWQLGHLISGEAYLGKDLPGAKYPALPAGFDEQHTKETAALDDANKFLTKGAYADLFNQMRAATVAIVGALSDADLDRPNPGKMAKFAPTMADLALLIANHTLMHGGQVAVLRRKLGKPILI